MERQIPYWLEEKWQEFANAIAALFEIPAAVIMKLDKTQLEVYLASDSPENPFESGAHADLCGSYCEAVIHSQQVLEVPDATQDPAWQHHPSIDLGVLNYLGYPLNYPDGLPFGSLCVFDKKKRVYSDVEKSILRLFREMVEQDIALVHYYNDKYADLVHTIRRQHNLIHQREDTGRDDGLSSAAHTQEIPQMSVCYFKELSAEVHTSLQAILSLSRVIQKHHVTPEDIRTYARGIERKSSRLLNRLSTIQQAASDECPKDDADADR